MKRGNLLLKIQTIPCDSDTVYFQNDIFPLIHSTCGKPGCHDNITAQNGVVLTSYYKIIQTGEIIPFEPDSSKIYKKITESNPDDRMPPPPNNPLSTDQINMIYKWILQGALNNSCEGGPCDSVNVTFSVTVWPIIKEYCYGCHSGPTPQGNVKLDNYFSISAQSQTIFGVITHSPGYIPMPYNGQKLNNCYIAQIKKWIDDGTPNN